MVEEWTPPAQEPEKKPPRAGPGAGPSSMKGKEPKAPKSAHPTEIHSSEGHELREGLVQSGPLLLLGGVALVIGFLASAGLLHGWNLGPTLRELLILAGVVAVGGGLVGAVLPDTEPNQVVCPSCGAVIPARTSARAPTEAPSPTKPTPEGPPGGPRGKVAGPHGGAPGEGVDWDEGAGTEAPTTSAGSRRKEAEVPIFLEDDESDEGQAPPPSMSHEED